MIQLNVVPLGMQHQRCLSPHHFNEHFAAFAYGSTACMSMKEHCSSGAETPQEPQAFSEEREGQPVSIVEAVSTRGV